MFCNKCGTEVPEGASSCPNCNAPASESVAEKAKDTFKAAESSLGGAIKDVFKGHEPGQPLDTSRNLLIFILLSLVTCGLYVYYFVYATSRDVNIACEGDGNDTTGVLLYFILSVITCGIYPIFWLYGLANRLQANAQRYGLTFPENGTTVLLWFIFGWLICFIGPFIAINIVLKNTNAICDAYNRKNGLA